MKKLLYWISTCLIALLIISCCVNKTGKNQEKQAAENKLAHDSISDTDTTSRNLPPNSDTLNNKPAGGMIEAPKHNSPNQAEVDSIKAAKLKLKNKQY